MNSTTAASAYDAVIAAYYTVISIVIVYHLFALQAWFDNVQSLSHDCISVERASVMGDVKRVDAIDEIEQAQRDYPWMQVVILGLAVAALGALAIAATCGASLSFIFWGTPTIVLWLVFIASSLASFLNGRRLCHKARKLLLRSAESG